MASLSPSLPLTTELFKEFLMYYFFKGRFMVKYSSFTYFYSSLEKNKDGLINLTTISSGTTSGETNKG